jgi:hypothetical protein
VKFLATTIPGLEGSAAEEIGERFDVDVEGHHRGMVAFVADPIAAFECNEHARSLHRVFVQVTSGPIEELEDAYDRTAEVDIERLGSWVFPSASSPSSSGASDAPGSGSPVLEAASLSSPEPSPEPPPWRPSG